MRADESTWTDEFAQTVVDEMVGTLTASIMADADEGRRLIVQARRDRQKAYASDRAQWTASDNADYTLVDARLGVGRSSFTFRTR